MVWSPDDAAARAPARGLGRRADRRHRGAGAGRRRSCEAWPSASWSRPTPHDDDVLRRRPRPASSLEYLDDAHTSVARGPVRRAGRPGPGRALLLPDARADPGHAAARPAATHARAGQFCYDTMTLVGPGTWEAARAAVDCALTAVDLVVAGERGGVRAVPAARPPRHPAGLRRVLLPQQRGRRRRRRCATPATSGSPSSTSTPTTATAPRRSSGTAPTCSTARSTSTRAPGWFPHVFGYADETRRRRRAQGPPSTCRSPRAPATALAATRSPTSPSWVVGRAARRWSSRSASTPRPTTPRARCWSPRDGYRAAGRLLGGLGLPGGGRPGGRLPPAEPGRRWSRRT